MEFFIPKVKRCGRSALHSHRREAAHIVFFTLLPLLLPVLFISNLSHISSPIVLPLFGKTFSLSLPLLSAGGLVLFLLLFYLPLLFGVKRWYLTICRTEQMRKPSIWYFFSSFHLYTKAILTGLSLFFRRFFLFLLGVSPAFSAVLVSVIFFRRASNDLERSLSLLCLVAAAGLFFCGLAAAHFIGKRYFWAPWLLANDPSLPLRQIFSESVQLTQKDGGSLRKIQRSLRGQRLFALCFFPAFWTIPLVECTLAAWISGKLPPAEPAYFVFPFRLRKIKRSPSVKAAHSL